MKNSSNSDPFHLENSPIKKRNRKRKKKNNDDNVGFMNQSVDLVDSILFPEGYENIMLALYFAIVPYIVGLLFIFFYIGKGDTTVFLSLSDENSFLITWAIGYEVTAAIMLLWIAKLGLTSFFQMSAYNKENKKFRIP